MQIKRAVATFIGVVQSLIGIASIAFAYLIYYNPDYLEVRAILNIPNEHVALYILLLGIIGLFSIVSGLLIVYEWGLTQ